MIVEKRWVGLKNQNKKKYQTTMTIEQKVWNGLKKIDPKVAEGLSGLAATAAIMKAIREQEAQSSRHGAQQSAEGEEPET